MQMYNSITKNGNEIVKFEFKNAFKQDKGLE